MRVTILGINYAPETTGIAPYTTALAEGLASRGHRIDVVTGMPHYPAWRIADGYDQSSSDEQINGVDVHRRRHLVPDPPTPKGRVKMEASFGARSVRSGWNSPDVLLCVSPTLISTAMAITRARLSPRRPAVGVWVQDLYSLGVVETGAMDGRGARAAARFESEILRAADGVSVIHDRFRDHVTSNLQVDPAKVEVIRNWTHIQPMGTIDKEAVRRSFGWAEDETIVLHSGNMGAKQGLENVVEAARLADAESRRVRFVLMGDGNQRPQLEAAAVGVSRLQFVRPLPDLEFRSALAAADVLLVNEKPGVAEMAVPSKLTSYFTSGNPVLAATDPTSTTAHEIRASGAGVHIGSGDPRELLDTALAIGSDDVSSRRFGDAGRRYCTRVLSEDYAIDRYEGWLRRLAAARRSPARTESVISS
ncbi:glycosyltransferase [Rhodococcus sp. BP-241]|nr:glycosyltransferase [Rhodococcus sp. BP-241]